jgi:hypothetical protein
MTDKRDDAIVLEAYALACQAHEIVREAMAILTQMRAQANAATPQHLNGDSYTPRAIHEGSAKHCG